MSSFAAGDSVGGTSSGLRILVVNNLYPPETRGGYELECMGVVEHLRSRHEVEVLTSKEGRPAPDETAIHRVLPFVHLGPVDSLLAPLHAVAAARRTQQLLDGFNPDLVLVFNAAAIPYTVIGRIVGSGAPLALRVCDWWFGDLYVSDRLVRHLPPGERGLRGLWARALRIVNRLHPELRVEMPLRVRCAVSWVSGYVRDATEVPEGFEVVDEVTQLPANQNMPRFAGIVRRPQTGDPELFFAGRLSPEKGADVAIRAVSSLERRHGVMARLTLAGAGSQRERETLLALAGELGVADRIAFAGPLDFEQMAPIVARCAAWVVPSVWDEPAGMVALEAALARVPAVLSRVGGIPEILRDEDEALMFDRRDHDALADAVLRALTDASGTERRVANAHVRALELSWDAYLAATDSFVDNAIAALAQQAVSAATPPSRP